MQLQLTSKTITKQIILVSGDTLFMEITNNAT